MNYGSAGERLVIAVVFALVLPRPTAALERVRLWEESVVFPSYPLGPDDVNPHFYELEGTIIYPYTMQDRLTSEEVDRRYRGVFLENEYLKILCLPEIGGRIQYVFDKRRQEPMFYYNRVIRPGLVALRGAWVSGGIEWNRGPQGHTVTSFSPVDVTGVENADGSASLLIGNLEKNFRTGWRVRLTLHPGRTYLDEEIVLFNPTDGFHPYYFWNNTAFPNRPGTRFVFPMTLGSDHDGRNFFSWPVHEGVDLTWLRNYEEPTSVFAYRSVFDFFGAYDRERDYGIVQVSDHRVLPGKKAWTWGQAESGLVSQSVLTDEDGPYIEVQSGPLPTQADFAPLPPGGEVRWRELWYPAFGLGEGYEYATQDVVVARLESEDGVELRFHATSDLGTLRLRAGGLERELRLTPERTERVLVPGTSDASLDVALRREDGTEVLSYRSPLAIPLETPPKGDGDEAPRTADELYRAAQDLDLRLEREAAREGYQKALDRDPDHRDAAIALSSLDLEAGLWSEAAKRLERVEGGMARYLGAVAALHRGEPARALELGEEASRDPDTRSLGLGIAGRALMRLGRSREALVSFRAAQAEDELDRFRLFDETLIAALAVGDPKEKAWAVERARDAVETGTLDLVPRVVLELAGDEDRSPLGGAARAYLGEDEFVLLETALRFADLGRLQEALRVLASTDGGLLVRCYQAYWSDRLGRRTETRRFLEEIPGLSSDYVFPSRPESLEVLDYVASETGLGAVYLIRGNLLAGLGRLDEAVVSFREAVRRDPTLSVAHRNLAMVAWKRAGALDEAEASFRRAIEARPSDQTLYRDLAKLQLERGAAADAIRTISSIPEASRTRPDVTLVLVRSLLAAERFDEAIDRLSATTFSNREGDSDTWRLHSTAHLERGKRRLEAGRFEAALEDFESALTYPRNLNVGRPAKPREAKALYFRGRALESLGRRDEARKSYADCASSLPLGPEQETYIDLCRRPR